MPELQVVLDGQEYTDDLEIVAPDLDAAEASDARLREAAEYHFDLGEGVLSNHQVTRPATSNILIAPKAVFG